MGERHDAYRSNFDFGIKSDTDGDRKWTIKDLLDELNYEKFRTATGVEAKKSDSNGTAVTYDSLSGALKFIDEIAKTGKIKQAQAVPLTTLKTIKLLYNMNEGSDKHLFTMLKSPLRADRATLDFYTTESPSANSKGNSIVKHLLSSLRKEVDPLVLSGIDTSFLTYSKLLECIAKENEEILGPIYKKHSAHPKSLTRAFNFLAELIKKYEQRTRLTPENPVHEKLYTYLRALPFVHFVKEDQYIAKLAEVKDNINNIDIDIDNFCNDISKVRGVSVLYDTPIVSINSFPAFVEENTLILAKLINSATGISSEKRDLLGIIKKASKLLCVFEFHQWRDISLDAVNLSVADCVSALCAIRYQQKVKTNYSVYWPGITQNEKGTSILRQMEESKGCEELFEFNYIPHGINLFMYHRFSYFYMALTGQLERYLAWKRLEAERFNKYIECYRSNDVCVSDKAVFNFDLFCRLAAEHVADLIPIE